MVPYQVSMVEDLYEGYDLAVGPGGFECCLTEPGRNALKRLNEQHTLLVEAIQYVPAGELLVRIQTITGVT